MRASLASLPVVLALTTGCAADVGNDASSDRSARPEHVLLVTLDTFRGDYLGAAGSTRVATPNLDALARRGALFTRARAPVPLTLPSHASLFTGLFPPEHGIRDNARFRLAPAHETLAERLREAGFRTAGFPAAFVLDARFGLDQGFDHYDDEIPVPPEELESPEAERSGEDVLASFFSWLDSGGLERPFFAWVHLFEPHAPYEAPEPFRSRYPEDPYAAEVAYTDDLVGRLVAGLADRNALASTLVIVVGDHGEGLGDHGETTHGLLVYNSTLHVPLLLAGPGVAAAARVEGLVRTTDVAPTILEILGRPSELGRGRSLRPLWETAEPADRAAYSESLYASFHLGWSPLFGIEAEDHHFIDAPAPELYEVLPDPGETRDLLHEERARVRQLRDRLRELQAELDAGESSSTLDLDEDARARIESLGYLSTQAPAPAAGDLPDPKDRIEQYELIRAASAARRRGNCRRAIASLAPLAAAADPIPLVYETLGACYLDLGDARAAERIYRAGVARGVRAPSLHVNLGVISLGKGRLVEAEREIEAALALEGNNVVAHYHLGDVHRAARRDEEALASYRRALELNPRYVYAWSGMGVCLARLGREEEALSAFREVVRLAPEEPRGLFNLAAQLERTGHREEAIEVYDRFLEMAPATGLERERERAVRAMRALSAR